MYFLKLNIAFIILFAFYKLVFSNDTFFSWRRISLLGLYVVALLVPGLNCSYWLNKSVEMSSVANEYANVVLPVVTITPNNGTVQNWEAIVTIAYCVVASLLFLRFLWQLFSIFMLRHRCETAEVCGVKVYLLDQGEGPFSFFSWIFMDPKRHNPKELDEIITHELLHCRQYHSLDILITELFSIAFWINPFVWLLKREVRLNLEFLADNSVLTSGLDSKEYQYHLLGLAYRKNVATISNNFNVLPLKKRIKMMNKKRTKGVAKAKYVLCIPMAVMLLVVSNVEIIAREIAAAANDREVPIVRAERQVMKPLTTLEEKSIKVVSNDMPSSIEKETVEKETVVPQVTENEPSAVTDDESFVESPEEEQTDQTQKKGKQVVYTVSEEMPTFKGNLLSWLSENIKYPVEAASNGEQGTVIVKYIITANGEVKDPVIVRSISPSLDKEALRVVSVMPRWDPGKNKGKAVSVYYTIPVRFKLQ